VAAGYARIGLGADEVVVWWKGALPTAVADAIADARRTTASTSSPSRRTSLPGVGCLVRTQVHHTQEKHEISAPRRRLDHSLGDTLKEVIDKETQVSRSEIVVHGSRNFQELSC
jgi:hypothetical protein